MDKLDVPSGWHFAGEDESLSFAQITNLDTHVSNTPIVRWADDQCLEITSQMVEGGYAWFILRRETIASNNSVILYRGNSLVEAIHRGNIRVDRSETTK